jgi:hypothetical protein
LNEVDVESDPLNFRLLLVSPPIIHRDDTVITYDKATTSIVVSAPEE